MDRIEIKRALISVSDKTGVVELANELRRCGVEILSTGGTASALAGAGIDIRTVDSYTGHPEMLDGRVKTLHPKVHGALLARRDLPEHVREVKEMGLELIDMVVVNLYPFEKTVAEPGVSLEDAVENIDIGGPTMLRSAAKNFEAVAVVTSSEQYARVIEQLRSNDGALDLALRFELAKAVFRRTSEYDRHISEYLEGVRPQPGT